MIRVHLHISMMTVLKYSLIILVTKSYANFVLPNSRKLMETTTLKKRKNRKSEGNETTKEEGSVMCTVMVRKQSCKHGNHPILRGVEPYQEFFIFLFFPLEKNIFS